MKKQVKVLYLCADLLDFDGTRGDMLYFLSRAKAYGIKVDYTEHQLGEIIDVQDFDFIYAGVCPQKYETLYLKHLKSDIKGLADYIKSGKPMLAVEQSFLFLTENLIDEADTAVSESLVGILPFSIKRLTHYAIGNVLLQSTIADFQSKINGFINTRYYYDFPEEVEHLTRFGSVLLGIDFLWERNFEGIRYYNFIGTQLRGPILPRNYDLCDWLIKKMVQTDTLPAISSDLEEKAKHKLTDDCEKFIESGEQKKEYVYVS